MKVEEIFVEPSYILHVSRIEAVRIMNLLKSEGYHELSDQIREVVNPSLKPPVSERV